MNQDLEKIREIFLTEVDEETRLDNERQIIEWETSLRENEAIAEWRDHDITKKLALQAKESYKECAMQLGLDRRISTETRERLWAKQDACLFLLSLIEVDATGALERIRHEIRNALNATN